MASTDGLYEWLCWVGGIPLEVPEVLELAAGKEEEDWEEEEDEDWDEDWSEDDEEDWDEEDDEPVVITLYEEETEAEIEEGEDGGIPVTKQVPHDLQIPDWQEIKTSNIVWEIVPLSKHGEERVKQFFPNVTSCLEYVDSPTNLGASESLRYSRRDRRAQTMGLDWEQFRALADTGWAEGVEYVDRLSEKLRRIVAGAAPVEQIQYDVTGIQLDIGRWVEEDPEEFMYLQEVEIQSDKPQPKILRIVTTVDIASESTLKMRGAAVVALTQLLELYGYRVILDAHIGSNRVVDSWIRLKDAGDAVNLESLLYWTAHPGMFWYMSYAMWEHLDENTRRRAGWLATQSIGFISEPWPDERGDYYVSAISSASLSSETVALKWIVKGLADAGIEVDLEQVIGG